MTCTKIYLRTPLKFEKAHLKIYYFLFCNFNQINSNYSRLHVVQSTLSFKKMCSTLKIRSSWLPLLFSGSLYFFAAIFTMRNKQRENVYNSMFFFVVFFILFVSIHTANHRHHRQIKYLYTILLCVAVSSTGIYFHLLKNNSHKKESKSTL